MTIKVGEVVQEVFKNVKEVTYGNASLLMGHGTLKRANDAGVSPSQMRAMFPDLQNFSDAKIEGFIEIGDGLVDGAISVPSFIFNEPKWDNLAADEQSQS